MTEATFSNVTVSRPTATIVEDLLTLDSVDGRDGNGAALRFIDNSTTAGLHLALGRMSARRVNNTTVRLDLAVAADPSASSSEDTPPLLSLVSSDPGGRSVTTPADSMVALGGTLTVDGNATFSGNAVISGTLGASGTTALNGGLTVGGMTRLSSGLTVSGTLSASGAVTLNGRLTIEDEKVPLILRETGQAITAGGLWRMPLDGGILRFDVNTGAQGQEFGSNFRTVVAMNSAGNVTIGGSLDLAGGLDVNGDINLAATRSFYSPGRMHIHGEENLYLLNKGGVIVARARGGNGNLLVEGDLRVVGQTHLGIGDGQVMIAGNRGGLFMKLHDDLWFSDPQNGTIQIKNGNNSNWGTMIGNFLPPSSIEYKKDTSLVIEPELADLLDDTLHTDIVRFRYTGDDETSRLRLGVIVENCPSYLVGEDGKSLSSNEYITMLHGAIKVLASRIALLETKLAAN